MHTDVNFELLTRESFVRESYSCDASDLGWKPGQWPQAIKLTGQAPGNGLPLVLRTVDANGTHYYRQNLGSVQVRIFND